MSVYLDASAILPLLMPEPHSAAAERFFRNNREELVVSEFAAAEVASALSRLVRTGRIEAEQAAVALADFDAWRLTAAEDIDIRPADLRLAHAWVRRFELMLRTPDALHVALCRRADLSLATLDGRLAQAAQALGVRTRLLG